MGPCAKRGFILPCIGAVPESPREAVVVNLSNENRPSIWEQVSDYIDNHGEIGNAELRKLMDATDTLRASKKLKERLDLGYLVLANPNAAKRYRGYTKPDGGIGVLPFSSHPENE